jgi:hypothetical protein
MSKPLDSPSPKAHTPPKPLSASSIGALRFWLQSQRSGTMAGRELRHSEVRRAMQLICGEVRKRGIPVERLIILLKEQWFSLTDDGDGATPRSRDALEKIIRTCIDEFYASAAGLSAAPTENGAPEATAT